MRSASQIVGQRNAYSSDHPKNSKYKNFHLQEQKFSEMLAQCLKRMHVSSCWYASIKPVAFRRRAIFTRSR